jgi:hypothetical protein
MQFKNEKCSFTIPDRPTVRQQLAYFSAGSGHSETLVRYWEGAKALMQDWQSEILPDSSVSLDELSDPAQTSVIIWAGLEVLKHMNALEEVPKN